MNRARIRDHRVGEAVVAALMRVGQLAMVQSQRVQQRGVQIVNTHHVLDRSITEIVRGPMDMPFLETTAGEP